MSIITNYKKQKAFSRLVESDTIDDNTIEIAIPRGTNPITLNPEGKHSVTTYKTNSTNSNVKIPVDLGSANSFINKTLHVFFIDNSESDADAIFAFKAERINVMTVKEDLVGGEKVFLITVPKNTIKGFIGTISYGKMYFLPGYER